MQKKTILVDGRWIGNHGIGRISHEILPQLKDTDIIKKGPKPLSLRNLIWQTFQLHRVKHQYRIFFTPGFNPVFNKNFRYILTICDLIYLDTPGLKGIAKKLFFNMLVKRSLRSAYKIMTISEYSKKSIHAWTGISEDHIINMGCGISAVFSPEGPVFNPGYPYVLHVGNTNAHKNIARLITAFAEADIDSNIKLVLTGKLTKEIKHIVKQKSLQDRLVFSQTLSENDLAKYYRGAIALLFPSLYEGFGLPILEAMACGIPVLTSNVTSCPEVAGDAAILIDPYHVESIRTGIENIVNNIPLRNNLILKGFERIKYYSWEKTTDIAQKILNEAAQIELPNREIQSRDRQEESLASTLVDGRGSDNTI